MKCTHICSAHVSLIQSFMGIKKRLLKPQGCLKLILALLLLGSLQAQAQEKINQRIAYSSPQSQHLSNEDLALVLQTCLDRSEFQSLLPLNDKGEIKPLYLMQFPFTVPAGLVLKIKNNPVFYIEKYAKPTVDAYIMVRNISMNESSIRVNINLFTRNPEGVYEMKNIFGVFNKNSQSNLKLNEFTINQF